MAGEPGIRDVIAEGVRVLGKDIGVLDAGIVWGATVSGGKCLDFDGVVLAAGSTKNIWSFGDSTTKEVTITDYYFPVRMNVTSIANPGGHRMAALMYLKFNVTTENQANLDMQGIGLSMDLAKDIRYAHPLDIGVNISGDINTVSGVHVGKFTLNLTSGKTLTAHSGAVLFAQVTGTGSYVANPARLTIAKLHVATGASVGSYIHFHNLGSAEFGIDVSSSGNIGRFINFGNPNGGTGAKTGAACDTNSQDSDGAIKIVVGGTDYFIPYYTAGNTSGSW